MCLVLATQRAVISALGGGGVRANMSETLVGKTVRASESRHATGAEKEIPDIREYSKGAPGYFQDWDQHSGVIAGRGRAFLLGKPPDELAYMKRLVAARRDLRDWGIRDLPPLALDDDRPRPPRRALLTKRRSRSLACGAGSPVSPRPPPRPRPRPRRPLPGKGPFPRFPACPRRSWRPCTRSLLPAAHQPQRQAWPWVCRRPSRTSTSPRCARTGTPRSPEAAGPPAGSSRNAQRCPKTSGPRSIGTSRPGDHRPVRNARRPRPGCPRWPRRRRRGPRPGAGGGPPDSRPEAALSGPQRTRWLRRVTVYSFAYSFAGIVRFRSRPCLARGGERIARPAHPSPSLTALRNERT